MQNPGRTFKIYRGQIKDVTVPQEQPAMPQPQEQPAMPQPQEQPAMPQPQEQPIVEGTQD